MTRRAPTFVGSPVLRADLSQLGERQKALAAMTCAAEGLNLIHDPGSPFWLEELATFDPAGPQLGGVPDQDWFHVVPAGKSVKVWCSWKISPKDETGGARGWSYGPPARRARVHRGEMPPPAAGPDWGDRLVWPGTGGVPERECSPRELLLATNGRTSALRGLARAWISRLAGMGAA